jgi:hypothetical protein
MTHLFNLDSCPNTYQYAYLNNPSNLTTPATHRLWYQQWLQKSTEFSCLEFPLLLSDRTPHLQTGSQKSVHPGVRLGEQSEQVYLVADSLSSFYLSQELPGQKYLYSSAYHYWNQINFFRENPQKSLVVVDLDRFLAPGDVLVPLSFESHPTYSAQIPIITKAERFIPVNLTPQSSTNPFTLALLLLFFSSVLGLITYSAFLFSIVSMPIPRNTVFHL